ncbi:hypothetical protein Holit_02368 [Hollandina sp. SP2]
MGVGRRGGVGGGGGGNLSYTITHPAGLDSATLLITKADGTALANGTINLLETGNNSGTKALDAGSYRVQARLVQGGLTAGKTESFHIYPTLALL